MLIVFCTALVSRKRRAGSGQKRRSLNDDGAEALQLMQGKYFSCGLFCSPSITFGFTTLLIKAETICISLNTTQWQCVLGKEFRRSSFESEWNKIDADGNIFVTGTFSVSKIIFDTDTLLNHSIGFR